MHEQKDIPQPPLEEVKTEATEHRHVTLKMLRLDKSGTRPAGNKWFKLKYNLQTVLNNGYAGILTFGGAWSNHIYATALAGYLHSLKTVGVIRGEHPEKLSDTLRFARDCGMDLRFVSRLQYRQKEDPAFQERLREEYNGFYILPEGGTNALAVQGTAEIPSLIRESFDFICCPCGTGGTLAGIASGLTGNGVALGFPVLKNEDALQAVMEQFVPGKQWELVPGYHCGGFAKINAELTAFMQTFETENGVPLEPLYSAKMLYGFNDLVHRGYFPEGSRIVVLHTGGLQGKAGMLPHLEKYGYSMNA